MQLTKLQVEAIRGFCRPKAHRINNIVAVSGDRRVVWKC